MCCILILLCHCSKYSHVRYGEIEETNSVEITLTSGNKVEGTILYSEPHQLTILEKDRQQRVVGKSAIRSIRRRQPIKDEFGRGISEEEIAAVKTSKNTLIYGIGGGVLSFGSSFFLGSLTSHSMAEDGGTALAASTAVGGGLGTLLFVRAGIAKDRKDAIQFIRDERRTMEYKKEAQTDETQNEIQKLMNEEKGKQEALRKEREKLLRELEEKDKKKKKKKQ